MAPVSLWDDAEDDAWLTALESHPEAIDHLDVLDDLVLLLNDHLLADVYGIDNLIPPLLLRASRILQTIPLEDDQILSWGFRENRPGLRLLAQLVLYYQDTGGRK